MASSGKQALVGRRERTSLKAPAGEAKTQLNCSKSLQKPPNTLVNKQVEDFFN